MFSSFFGGKRTAKIHSNGIAQIGSKSIVGGSTSPEPFAKRQHVAKNRQVINDFKHSAIATGYRANALGDLQQTRSSLRAAREQRFGTQAQTNNAGVYGSTPLRRSTAKPGSTPPQAGAPRITTRRYDPYK